jgi:serine/threonine protein kinase
VLIADASPGTGGELTAMLVPPEPIPGYRIIDRLGSGGFGEVWKCEAPGGMLKAIKFVYGNLDSLSNDTFVKQELKSLERIRTIRHPFILSLERFDIIEGRLIIVNELAECTLWDKFCEFRAEGLHGIPRDELIRYMQDAAEALDFMNAEHGMQHLDIKPTNLFLSQKHVKVADFGMVKMLEGSRAKISGSVTPVYAAPETFEGWVSRHSDQYSLGIVYEELFSGHRPFTGKSAQQILYQHMTVEPNLRYLLPKDRAVVRRALSKDPNKRFETCTAFVEALKRAKAPPAQTPPKKSPSDPNLGSNPDVSPPAS